MCCFSLPVEQVSNTNIFAHRVNGRQFLVYSMEYAAASDLAMVLPLPVPPNSPEDAVRFINLERYQTFFDDMRRGFPEPVSASRGSMPQVSFGAPTLKVHDVGSFEASFVPRIKDFDRLDKRFRIPGDVWDGIPEYDDYGFAVFKLKGNSAGPLTDLIRNLLGAHNSLALRHVHPMAFEFPSRDPDRLFFPTLHIHDRQIHARAEFDHTLYAQANLEWPIWNKSTREAAGFMDIARSEGIVNPTESCWSMRLEGSLDNRDTWVMPGRLAA